ncbi:uncharacterized protein [Typha latifolia]|uniref:uncharacterized protein n=1 Tax=Typha latifolia TaxID=4733 RepID=UPI003C2CBC8A
MAIKSPTKAPILFLLLLSSILAVALCKPGYRAQVSHPDLVLKSKELPSQGLNKEEMWIWKSKTVRRLMIGSAAPTCTFNECRGCRFKCSAEQVPVDANDPMNSAYHYKCLCHR